MRLLLLAAALMVAWGGCISGAPPSESEYSGTGPFPIRYYEVTLDSRLAEPYPDWASPTWEKAGLGWTPDDDLYDYDAQNRTLHSSNVADAWLMRPGTHVAVIRHLGEAGFDSGQWQLHKVWIAADETANILGFDLVGHRFVIDNVDKHAAEAFFGPYSMQTRTLWLNADDGSPRSLAMEHQRAFLLEDRDTRELREVTLNLSSELRLRYFGIVEYSLHPDLLAHIEDNPGFLAERQQHPQNAWSLEPNAWRGHRYCCVG